ncbi:AAA family ATPase [Actinoplanes sp. NPDC051470]|uniref:helix-turn-helix transcriptional regulator n=1 Tax=Actinoplanes sp. NPDC051470 TaxID=3157224 RepID=UPI003413C3EA
MRRRWTIAGRREQLEALDQARLDAASGGRFVLVNGPSGSGRTALLEASASAWRAAGAAVLRVPGPAAGGVVAGFEAVLHVVRDQYERLADPLLSRPLSTIAALCADSGTDLPGRSAMLAEQTSMAFGLIGRRVPAVLLADDLDDAPGLVTALASAVRDQCMVVASARAAGGRLTTLADVVVALPPLAPDAVGQMLVQRYGAPLDEAVLPALTTALGPLAGNPATVAATVDALTDAGRLAVIRGHLCLLDPQIPIVLPPGHRLVAGLHQRGTAAVRIATMAAVTRFGLDDLPLFARATLGRLDSYGRTVDELVTDGVLLADPQGGIRPQSPALAARLIADAGPQAVARLHRAYAAAMFRRAGAAADRSALADHVAFAGPSMPTDRRTAVSLAATAAEVTDREPDRAADWLRAALWHAGGGRAADDILSRLSRLLIRTGQFTRLAEVVRAAPAGRSGDLATAAALASLHTGTRMPEVMARLGPAAEPIFRLVDRWLTGAADGIRPAAGASDFAIVGRALGDGVDPADPATEELLVAGSTGDLVALFGLVLGSQRYGTPADGPLAAYHRLHDCYARGDLSGVVSAAREVELAGAQALVVRRLARLWAAEALAMLGKDDDSRSWMQSVPDEPPYAALRWWAENSPAGEATTAEEAADRLRGARVAYERQRAHGSRIGCEQLLVRAAILAGRFGLTTEAAELAVLAGTDQGRWLSTETTLLVRALATGDTADTTSAAGLIRARAHRPALGLAVLALGRMAADPSPWLLDARAVAEEIGSRWLRSAVAATMRDRDVRRPRPRSAQEAFSEVEVQIIDLIRQAYTNRQIAAHIRMSEKTIENYLTRLFVRTGCRSRVELAAVRLTTGVAGSAR